MRDCLGESDGSIIKPQMQTGCRYALVDDRTLDTAEFIAGGGALTAQGPTPARSSVNMGCALLYALELELHRQLIRSESPSWLTIP
jgi:hypothetical protein